MTNPGSIAPRQATDPDIYRFVSVTLRRLTQAGMDTDFVELAVPVQSGMTLTGNPPGDPDVSVEPTQVVFASVYFPPSEHFDQDFIWYSYYWDDPQTAGWAQAVKCPARSIALVQSGKLLVNQKKLEPYFDFAGGALSPPKWPKGLIA